MSIDALREFFGWCIVINYGVLIVWFVLFAGARDWVHRLHEHWFRLTREQFDTVRYAGYGTFQTWHLPFRPRAVCRFACRPPGSPLGKSGARCSRLPA